MDLLAIARKIWLYRVVTLPVLILTLLGGLYVVVIKSPEYEASSSYVLIQPPPPPTQEDIAMDPSLGRINADNPFTRFTDQSAVVGVLASRLSNESSRDALSEKGADKRYTVAPSSEFSTSSLLVEITGVGSSPEQAVGTAELVGAALVRELDDLQATQNVAQDYRIQAQPVTAPDAAQLQVSSTLRPLVGVLAMGGILLFVVVSAAEALSSLGLSFRGGERSWASVRGREIWASVSGREDKQDPLEGAVANRTSSTSRRERRRRSRSAGGKNGVPKGKDRQDPIEGPTANDEKGNNFSPGHERQGRPRGAGSKA
jgi:hypothetical protein